MSDAGTAYVKRYSPYRGAYFLVHFQLGALENDTYGHRLWVSDKNLAAVCRCAVKTVSRAKAQMVRDGFLARVSPAGGRRTAEYEFLFPDVPVVAEMVAPRIGGHSRPDRWTSTETTPTYRKEVKRGSVTVSAPWPQPPDFDESEWGARRSESAPDAVERARSLKAVLVPPRPENPESGVLDRGLD